MEAVTSMLFLGVSTLSFLSSKMCYMKAFILMTWILITDKILALLLIVAYWFSRCTCFQTSVSIPIWKRTFHSYYGRITVNSQEQFLKLNKGRHLNHLIFTVQIWPFQLSQCLECALYFHVKFFCSFYWILLTFIVKDKQFLYPDKIYCSFLSPLHLE